MKPNTRGDTPPRGQEDETARLDEAALLEMLEAAERKHGYVPRELSDEVGRLLEVRLERMRRIQGKLDSTIRRDLQDRKSTRLNSSH